MKLTDKFRNIWKFGEIDPGTIRSAADKVASPFRHAKRIYGRRLPIGVDSGWRQAKEYSQLAGTYSGGYGIGHMHAIRALVTTSPFLRSYMKQMEINVVGSHGPQITLTRVKNSAAKAMIEEMWTEWACDSGVDGNSDWPSLLKSMVLAYAVDGRSLGLMKYSGRYNMGFGVLPLPREWMGDLFYGMTLEENVNGVMYKSRNGAIYYDDGRILGYKLYKDDPALTRLPVTFPYQTAMRFGETTIVPAELVADYSNVAAPWNVDHVPEDILATISGLRHITDLDEATNRLMKTYVSRLGMGAIEIDPVKAPPPDYKDSPLEENDDVPTAIDPGVHLLDPGMKFVTPQMSAPTANQERYRSEILKNIAAALAGDYGTLSGDLKQISYSSLRHAVTQARDAYRNHQSTLGSRVVRKIFARWLEHVYMSGMLKRSVSDVTIKRAIMSPWRFRSYEYIDPTKDALAVKNLIAMGLTSPQIEASARGRNFLDIVDDFAQAKASLEASGVGAKDFAVFSGSAFDKTLDDDTDGNEEQENEENQETNNT